MEKKLNYQEPALIELESLFSGEYIVIGDSSCTDGNAENIYACSENVDDESDWE